MCVKKIIEKFSLLITRKTKKGVVNMPNQVRHGKRLFKQMAMEVAVRNPERYPAILAVFAKYEGKILDDECILEIYKDLFVYRAIESDRLDVDNSSEVDIKNFIKSHLTHNNEWGFPTGYQAGFTRYLKTLSELGFIYMQYKDTIGISEVAKALLNNELEVSEAFALQCMRFWRKSPYRRVLNDFNYFSFILKVLLKLKENNRSLSYPQFILSLFNEDGNVDEFISQIETIKLGDDIDAMYEYIVDTYSCIDELHPKVNKQQTVVNDYGNTVFRVLQLTGLISVENKSGILLISINENRKDFLTFLSQNEFAITEAAKENEEIYFKELGALSDALKNDIDSYRETESLVLKNYNAVLNKVINDYGITEAKIVDLIKSISNDNKEKLFWYIQKPLKLEFFISMLIYLKYGNEFIVKPNYKADDKGIPYQHAPGNIGDINITSNSVNWLVEVTLIRNKVQQLNNETADCIRHLKQSEHPVKYLSFVAPVVHPDTSEFYKNSVIGMIIEDEDNCYIKAYNIDNFVDTTQRKYNLSDMRSYRDNLYSKMRKKFSE